jgi:hypothetical protein
MTTPRPIAPDQRILALLPGASFADSYGWQAADAEVDAVPVARALFDAPPRWIDALMALRNLLVALIGLKPAPITGFPVLHQSPDRMVLGLDDHHLDFRIIVLADGDGTEPRRITLGTVVRTHNLLGRAYLAVVIPFHRVIVRTMLRKISALA